MSISYTSIGYGGRTISGVTNIFEIALLTPLSDFTNAISVPLQKMPSWCRTSIHRFLYKNKWILPEIKNMFFAPVRRFQVELEGRNLDFVCEWMCEFMYDLSGAFKQLGCCATRLTVCKCQLIGCTLYLPATILNHRSFIRAAPNFIFDVAHTALASSYLKNFNWWLITVAVRLWSLVMSHLH